MQKVKGINIVNMTILNIKPKIRNLKHIFLQVKDKNISQTKEKGAELPTNPKGGKMPLQKLNAEVTGKKNKLTCVMLNHTKTTLLF